MRSSKKSSKKPSAQKRLMTKDSMCAFYFEDPKKQAVGRELSKAKLRYFYLNSEAKLRTMKKEALSGCLLSGKAVMGYGGTEYQLSQFDMFFIPSQKESRVRPVKSDKKSKICVVFSPSTKEVDSDFVLERFSMDKFTHRGEIGSDKKMSTYRNAWTAIRNDFFISGFTHIPSYSLRQGVVTSVNLDKDKEGNPEIRPHVHPEVPEAYIYCISDRTTAVTQYLISPDGLTVCRDLTDGEGAFFPGYLGHTNFVKPTYKSLNYCLYMWIMPTFGKASKAEPETLRV